MLTDERWRILRIVFGLRVLVLLLLLLLGVLLLVDISTTELLLLLRDSDNIGLALVWKKTGLLTIGNC